ncbi:MAG: signal peptidase I [bacterium]|nr:signal peptidase I [bacterium]
MASRHPHRSIPQEGFLRFIIDVLINSVVIIVLFFFVQKVVAAPFQVIGNSMVHTLANGEYIIVTKLEYLFGEPQRGDVIVFHPPSHQDEYYIKRIIGTPGDTVRLHEGDVYVNGQKLDETYLDDELKSCIVPHMQVCPNDDKTYTVPKGKYFVLGDNRKGSSDSRSWYDQDNKPDPFVTLNQIQGKTRVVVYPLPEIRLMPGTTVFNALE